MAVIKMPGILDFAQMVQMLQQGGGGLLGNVAAPYDPKSRGINPMATTEGARSYGGGANPAPPRLEVRRTNIGPAGSQYYWAYVDGKMLRAKNGVGRNFKTPEAAEAAAKKALGLE
jgi:hypothetical protein